MPKKQNKLLEYLIKFLIIFGVILVFTFFDFIVHYFYEYNILPESYFRNKIIFGTVLGFIIYLFIKKQSNPNKALLFSTTGVLLQFRYLISGYPINWIITFAAIHYIILLPVSYFAFKAFKKYI